MQSQSLFVKRDSNVNPVEEDKVPPLIAVHALIQSKLTERFQEVSEDPSKQILIKMKQILDDLFNQEHWSENMSELKGIDDSTIVTQSEIIEIAKKMYLNDFNETYDQLRQLRELNQEFYDKSSPCEEGFFYFIQKSIDSARDFMTQKSQEDGYEDFYSKDTFLFALANLLNARFFPHDQVCDPLLFNVDKGICYGDITDWVEQIKTGQYTVHAPRATPHVLKKQALQKNDNMIKVKEYKYSNFRDIWSTAHHILEKVNDNYIYSIAYIPHDEILGHEVGLRRISKTKKIEFREPNFGTFEFEDAYHFMLFFYLHFLESSFHEFKYNAGGKFILYNWGKQITPSLESPITAEEKYTKPGIPEITPDLIIMPKDYFKNTSESFKFGLRLQTLAVLLSENKINETHYKEQLFERLTIENVSLKNHFRKILIPKTTVISQKNEKKFELHTLNTEKIIKEIDVEKRRLGNTEEAKILDTLQKSIRRSRFGATLIAIVNETYKEKPITPFIENLINNYEINPAMIIILQKQLLKKLCILVDQDWSHVMPFSSLAGVRLSPTKILPHPLQTIRERFEKYVLSNENDIPALMTSIQEIFRRSLSLFSKMLYLRSEVEEFYSIMQELDCNHFSSLIKTCEKMDKFKKEAKSSEAHPSTLGTLKQEEKHRAMTHPSLSKSSKIPSETTPLYYKNSFVQKEWLKKYPAASEAEISSEAPSTVNTRNRNS